MLFLVIQWSFLFREFATLKVFTPKHSSPRLTRTNVWPKKKSNGSGDLVLPKTGEYSICRHEIRESFSKLLWKFMRREIFRFPGEMLINYFLGPWHVLKKFSVKSPTDLNNRVLSPLRLLLFERELKISYLASPGFKASHSSDFPRIAGNINNTWNSPELHSFECSRC